MEFDRPSLRRAASGESGSVTSVDSHPSRNLLFGEIDSNSSFISGRSLRSTSSVCNLVLSSNQHFQRFWSNEDIRNTFIAHLDRPTLKDVRLVCHDFGSRAAPFLFKQLAVDFRPTSFTKTRRMIALKKIGHHATSFTFRMPHSSKTCLPPLLDEDGQQHSFTYVPQVDRPVTPGEGGQRQPKYGSDEVTQLLIQQYPPLFHAATNVPAFIKALSYMRNLESIAIACPSVDTPQMHRRSIVDYALISLRIAVERAPLESLNSLTLSSIHPAALFYLQPILGIGSSPGSQRRWSQIENLTVHMTSFPFNDPEKTEHLRILHSYLRAFSGNLTSLNFSWLGTESGPSPLSLDKEPVLCPSDSPRFSKQPKALRLPRLNYMVLQNAVMDSSQVSSFISRHRKNLVEFTFEDVTLRSGDWDHALNSVRKTRRSTSRHHGFGGQDGLLESMDVPCVLSPIEIEPEPRIMETLEPQEEFTSFVPRVHFSMGIFFGSSSTSKPSKKLKKKDWTGAGHLKRALKSSVFSWR